MLKVLIADDEFWVREELKDIIQWDKLGLEIIGEAEDGEEALELIKKEKPHILITDIKMPFMSGIDLINHIKKNRLDCHVIAISGYDDFEYVKQAILNGASDYLLKPIKSNALTKILLQVVADIRQQHDDDNKKKIYIEQLKEASDIMINNQFTQIIQNTNAYPEDVRTMLSEKNLDANINQYTIVYMQILWDTKEIHQQDIKAAINVINDMVVSVIPNACAMYRNMNKNDELVIMIESKIDILYYKKIQQKIKKGLGLYTLIGISYIVNGINGFNLGYKRAEEAIYQIPIKKRFYINEWKSRLKTKSNANTQKPAITEHTFASDTKQTVLNYMLKYLLGENRPITIADVEERIGLCCESLYELDLINDEQKDTIDRFYQEVMWWACRMNISNLQQVVEDFCTEFCDFYCMNNRINRNENIKHAKEYIDKYFTKDQLSLSYLADVFHLNKEYLSRKFKEVYGVTVTNYIQEIRINEAKKLMENKTLKISEISNMIGYSDYAYFNKLFKKNIGMSPRDYIKKIHKH